MFKRLFLFLLFAPLCYNLFAQTLEPMGATATYAVSQITGIPFRETGVNYDVTGSPFLFDEWKQGKVILYNGSEYDNVMLRFNTLKNIFYFNRNDSVFELPDDATEVSLKNTADNGNELDFKKIISTDNKLPMAAFVQVLSNGKVPLYKQYIKRIEGDNFSNGLITTKKTIVDHNSLWTIKNNETLPVKLNSRSLEEITFDKKDQVLNFVKTKKLNIKNEKDFAEAITYYNSISSIKK